MLVAETVVPALGRASCAAVKVMRCVWPWLPPTRWIRNALQVITAATIEWTWSVACVTPTAGSARSGPWRDRFRL